MAITKSGVVAGVAFVAVGALIAFNPPANGAAIGVIGWIAVACMSVGAIVGVRERLAERRREHAESAERQAPESTGIQVLGTFLDEDTADHNGQGGAR